MSDREDDLETRVTRLESRIEIVAEDAAAARHLAAAVDRDIATLGIKVDANRAAINALGLQLNGRMTVLAARIGGLEARVGGLDARVGGLEARVEAGFAEVGAGFAEVRGRLDGAAAGQQRIVDLLTTLIDRDGGDGAS